MHQGLNPQQEKAVKTIDGRLLVLAGAGSGKTRVLTLRMAHLINDHGVSPKSIVGLTFTNKAAAEMRHRIGQLVPPAAAKHITLATFHSFCMQILRADIHHLGYTNNFTLYDEKDVQHLVTLIARDIIDREGEMPSLAHTIAAITHAKNKGMSIEEIVDPQSPWHQDFIRQVYKRLEDSLRAYNAVDFDHLLWLTVELFQKHPAVLDKYQERFRYLMIDEYQDTNPIQYRLASLLSAKYGNLCVVGDDDQSIYGWRGAEVKNILQFGDATTVKLEQNYRSTNTILKAANAVIGNNKERHQKVLWSNKGEGQPIEAFCTPNEVEEGNAVAYRIAKLHEMGFQWKDFAILYRSNALSRQFEMALMRQAWQENGVWKNGIPFQVFGGNSFYERREVRDLCAYLRVIVNPLDQEAILRVINQPRRGVGDAALDALTAYNRKNQLPLWQVMKEAAESPNPSVELHGRSLQGVREFINVIETAKGHFSTQSLQEAFKWLIDRVNFKKAIEESVKSDQMREFKWENVEEFVNAIADFSEEWQKTHDAPPSLVDFVANHPLEANWQQGKNKNRNENHVSLMTFHSSKGLEFPVCFLVGVEDRIIPHEKSMLQTGLEEERRLMYVALTRAMQRLFISVSVKRKHMGVEGSTEPSRFFHEIPKELIKGTDWGNFNG